MLTGGGNKRKYARRRSKEDGIKFISDLVGELKKTIESGEMAQYLPIAPKIVIERVRRARAGERERERDQCIA